MPIQKIIFSGSSFGRPININSLGQNIHVTGTSSSVIDVVYLWIYQRNSGGGTAGTVFFSLGDGGTSTTSAYYLTCPASPNAPLQVLNGFNISGNGTTGSTLSAQTTSINCYVFGYVNRIS